MDLDNLKKDWQENNMKVSISEDKIERMLNNKGKSAYDKLISYEKIFLYLLIFCLLIMIIIFLVSPISGVIYGLLTIVGFFWQKSKINLLKKTDLLTMDILEISQRINKYKSFLQKEILFGIFIIPLFCGIYSYDLFYKMSPKTALIGFGTMTAITFFSCFILYRVLYYNNIKRIEQSVKEVEEFEKDNI